MLLTFDCYFKKIKKEFYWSCFGDKVNEHLQSETSYGLRLFSTLCAGQKRVPHKLSTTHEVESPTRDPSEGVPTAGGQAELISSGSFSCNVFLARFYDWHL